MSSQKHIAVYVAHKVAIAGPWLCQERIIDKLVDTEFKISVLYWKASFRDNSRLPAVREKWRDRVSFVPFSAARHKEGPASGYTPTTHTFNPTLQRLSPDLLHVVRSGYYEWPLTERLCPIQIESNVMAGVDKCKQCDLSISISDWVHERNKHPNKVLIYNPVRDPVCNDLSFRDELSLQNSYVFGRIGRASLDDTWAYRTVRKLSEEYPERDFVFLRMGSGSAIRTEGRVIYIPPSAEHALVSKFFNTVDCYLHSQGIGETFGCGLVEAMAAGKPIITHMGANNGHISVLAGVCPVHSSFDTYYKYAEQLLLGHTPQGIDTEYGSEKFRKYFSIDAVGPQYLDLYRKLLP